MAFLRTARLAGAVLAVLLAAASIPAMAEDGILGLLPDTAVTTHSISVGDRKLDYSAEAGTLPLRDGKGATTAKVFYVAYSLRNAGPARPVTFVFNGGPGAASAYLHLGALGPMVVATSSTGEFLPPPARLVENPDTWLDMTDLVFVDPVGTGYSRAANPDEESKFWGVEADANSMGAFIRLYLQHAERMLSPVYLAGESYGGFRAALLSRTLQEDIGIAPSGAVLLSPALEFALLHGEDFDPLTWALPLPSMAAVELEQQGMHGRDALGARLADVERFALSDYLQGLTKPPEEGRRTLGPAVARLIGLPADLVERRNGRIPVSVFLKEFARANHEVRSVYDGTLAAPDVSPESATRVDLDPVLDRSVPALTSAFVQYARRELGYRTDITYRLLNGETNRHWDYGASANRQGFAGVLDDLQKARALNPALQVLIAQGYTDLITPYLAAKYLIGQLPILSGAAPIRVEVYEGGHMMYLRPDSRHALKEDALSMYASLPRASQ